jgi:hypothetical protein
MVQSLESLMDAWPDPRPDWESLAATWPPGRRAEHMRLVEQLVVHGFARPSALKLAAEKLIADAQTPPIVAGSSTLLES